MISARIDPPAVAPLPPQRPVQAAGGRDGRPATAFDDVLRDQETASATPDADSAKKDADAAPAPVPALDVAQLPAAAPIALDTLLAQVLPPPQQPQPQSASPPRADEQPQADSALPAVAPQLMPQPAAAPRESRRQGPVERHAPKEAAAGVIDSASVEDVESSSLEESPEAPALKPQHARSVDSPAPRAGAAPNADGQGATPARAFKDGLADLDDKAEAPTRTVAVTKVTSTTHFPVATDPVRQIATEVTRALDAKSIASAPDPQNAPVKTISVQLEPESLGAVTLRMRLSGDQLSVRVDVAEPATLELIQRERDRLQKSMATDNVSIDRLEIRASSDPKPVMSGDNANAPRQDTNAPGQQARQNATPQGGEQRREARGDSQSRARHKNGQDNDSARSSDSRGVYL